MAKRAQYNDGTGKAKYTAGTSKQQSYDTNAILAGCTHCQAPCGYCSGEQPEYIDVTFSGITEYTGCCRRGLLSLKINNSVVSSITGNTFRLAHDTGCVYATAPPPSGSIYEYGTIDCTGAPVNRNITSFHIAFCFVIQTNKFTITIFFTFITSKNYFSNIICFFFLKNKIFRMILTIPNLISYFF